MKISAVLVHGVSFGALAKSGGGQVMSDLISDIHLPIDPATIDVAGQYTSITAGGMMAGGIGAYTLFANSLKSSNEDKLSKLPEESPIADASNVSNSA